MKEITIMTNFQKLDAAVTKVKRQLEGTDQEIVTLRLQMNALVDMIKWIFPLNLMFKHFAEKEWKLYTEMLEKRRQQIQKMKEQMEVTKKIAAASEKQGRNEQCKCGSGKKYKKCCLEHKEIKIPSKPVDIEKALKHSKEVNKNKETKEAYIAREGKTGNE